MLRSIFGIVVGLSLLACVCGGGGSQPASPPAPAAPVAPAEGTAPANSPAPASPNAPAPGTPVTGAGTKESPAAKGDIFVVNEIETKVLSAKKVKKVSKNQFQNYSASEGAILVLVDFQVKNIGKKAESCLTFAHSITDASGTSYTQTSKCSMAVNSMRMETLNPGLPKKFQECFEVPDTASNFTIKFSCGWEEGYSVLGI